MGILTGSKGKVKQKTTLSKDQQEMNELIRQAIEEGTGPYADIFGKFNEEEFNKGVKEPALKDFQENILPQVQERFTASGQTGGSAQRRGMNKAGSDFQSKLAELMYNAKQQQKQNQIAGTNTLYGKQTVENIYKPGQEGILQGAVKGFANGAGQATGAAVAG